jgi:hypothetical protein
MLNQKKRSSASTAFLPISFVVSAGYKFVVPCQDCRSSRPPTEVDYARWDVTNNRIVPVDDTLYAGNVHSVPCIKLCKLWTVRFSGISTVHNMKATGRTDYVSSDQTLCLCCLKCHSCLLHIRKENKKPTMVNLKLLLYSSVVGPIHLEMYSW